MLFCSSELGFKEIYDWMCGSFSGCSYIFYYMVVYSICLWFLESNIRPAWF
ncbi:hypothetical protein CFP56_029051 [Quercus suber]|uniref:Uncharacterized protein n=1 Tax=Quercus suber TaxID=58331 RepID=A0AAW0JRY8_QUESU